MNQEQKGHRISLIINFSQRIHMMDRLIFNPDLATDLDQQRESKYTSMYKNGDKLFQRQQQRRNEILSNRQSKRDKMVASIRRLVSEVASDEEVALQDDSSDLEEPGQNFSFSKDQSFFSTSGPNHCNISSLGPASNIQFDSDRQESNTSVNHQSVVSNSNALKSSPSGKNAIKEDKDKKFRNKTMLSEWLLDRPMDLESEWVLRAIPAGRRCLIIAKKGETAAYSRTGKFIKVFQSALPGGSRSQATHSHRQFAIVDCIHVPNHNSFYLMDVLAWNQHKLYESEASLRFFWLQSRYNENKDKLLSVNSKNESKFYCLNTYPASDKDILKALHNDPIIREHSLQLDGLLFFHIRGPYVPGANPLVLWIKPDMVHRVLNLTN